MSLTTTLTRAYTATNAPDDSRLDSQNTQDTRQAESSAATPHLPGEDRDRNESETLRLNQYLEDVQDYIHRHTTSLYPSNDGTGRHRTLAEQFERFRAGGHLASGGSEQPSISLSDAIDVIVLELDYAAEEHHLRSLQQLQDYIHRHSTLYNCVFLVNGLSLAVMGSLGFSLSIDPEFFTFHMNTNTSVGSRLPSSVAAHRFKHFKYSRATQQNRIIDESVSLQMTMKSEQKCTSVFLMDDYDLTDDVRSAMDYRVWNPSRDRLYTPTLRQAIIKHIVQSVYEERDTSGIPTKINLSLYPILILEWSSVLTIRAQAGSEAHASITDIIWSDTTEKTCKEKVFNVRGKYASCFRSPVFYEKAIADINYATQSLQNSDAFLSRSLNAKLNVIVEDLRSVAALADRTKEAYDLLNKEVIALFRSVDTGLGGDEQQFRRRESSDATRIESQPPPNTNGSGANKPPGSGGPSLPLSQAFMEAERLPNSNGGGRREPPGSGPPHESFQNHIRQRIDQIAYVTNLLLSLSFIATLYGMNADLFVTGGLVKLKDYLITALPFACGVFLFTFVMPVAKLRDIIMNLNKLRRWKVEIV
ncbi:hypothetical protein OEA41_000015 [Lepraria neglecta]|uniref:Uncharacterized protein n=1 Tax=Lepraria neglecta TaxID=209136 RepID=A0AAE0DR54_9LECA|nr:hypothetical protein OEA41_000015 [Lepraria neglecta]